MAVAPQISGYPRMYAAVLCLFWTLCVGTVTTDFGKTINPRFRGTETKHVTDPVEKRVLHSNDEPHAVFKVPNELEHVSSRRLSQQNETDALDFTCSLETESIDEILDKKSRSWIITDTVLKDIGNNLQSIVNCTEAGDVLLFDTETVITPSRKIILPWNLTVSTLLNDEKRKSSPAPRMTNFTCPPDDGVFFVKSKDVVFKDLVFQDCELASDNFTPIIEIEGCELDGAMGSINFQDIHFVKNELANAPGIFAGSTRCAALEIADVMFTENVCNGVCFAHLTSSNALQNVAITQTGNLANDGTKASLHALIYMPPESKTTIRGLKATGNSITIIELSEGNMDLFDSDVSDNIANPVIHVSQSNASFVQLNCSNNKVNAKGGCLLVQSSNVMLFESTIKNNTAATGGAIHISVSKNFTMRSTNLSGNNAKHGGALYVDRSNLFLSESTLNGNMAGTGGAAFLKDSGVTFTRSFLTNNMAKASGGAIYSISSKINIDNSSILENMSIKQAGGGFMLIKNGEITITNSTVALNSAKQSGGGMVVNTGAAEIFSSTFRNNSADQDGGAIVLFSANITITESTFIGNTADNGGSLDIVSESNATIQSTTFEDDFAEMSGGSIAIWKNGTLTLEQSVFVRSFAQRGGGVSVSDGKVFADASTFLACNVSGRGGGIYAVASSVVYLSSCHFERNNATQGGAIYGAPEYPGLHDFQFDNCIFKRNNATNGGAICFTKEEISVCETLNDNCSFVALSGCDFVRNTASVGGAIFAAYPKAIRYQCNRIKNADPLKPYSDALLASFKPLNSTDSLCNSWKKNNASDYGPVLASFPRQIKAYRVPRRKEKIRINNGKFAIKKHLSGELLPNIELQLTDEINPNPAFNFQNETTLATMRSDDLLLAPVSTYFVNGTVVFAGLRGYGEPSVYNVTIDFSAPALEPYNFTVEISPCQMGYNLIENDTYCVPCTLEQYNFFPETKCKACPKNADCSKRLIRPRKNYFHWSPCSTHIQLCLSQEACDFDKRKEGLKNVTKDMENCFESDALVEKYHDAQCDEGYDGPICGSCKNGFGQTVNLSCAKCRDGSQLLFLVSVLVVMGLSAFTIRSNLPSSVRSQRSLPIERDEQQEAGPSTSLAIEMTEVVHETKAIPEEASTSERAVSEMQERSLKNADLAKWKMVEIFKVTINFLQVISVAAAINTDWTRAVIDFLSGAGFLGGTISDVSSFSLDCILSSDRAIPRSILRSLLSICIPAIAVILYALFWLIQTKRKKRPIVSFQKRTLLSFFAVAYLTYVSITRTASSIVSCVRIYDSTEPASDHSTHFWLMDTSEKCYKGPHAFLVGFVGWPALLLFSLGFPLSLSYLLIKNSSTAHSNPWINDTAGFLYRAYNPKFVYWESIIMLRKGLLVIIVVFGYELRSNIQGILAVCVLIFALQLHHECCPFRNEFKDLNEYEGASLFVSLFIFALSLAFVDDQISEAAKVVLTVFIFLAVCALFLFLAAKMASASIAYARISLAAEGVPVSSKRNLFVVKTFVSKKFRDQMNGIAKYLPARHSGEA